MLERCPFIEDMDIRYDGEQRIIEINNCLVRFTPNEYKLVRLLLAQHVVKGTKLFKALSLRATEKADAEMFTRCIDKIICKLTSHDLYRIHGYGYMFLPGEDAETGGVMLSGKSSDS